MFYPAKGLKYITENNYKELEEKSIQISKMLSGLIKSLYKRTL